MPHHSMDDYERLLEVAKTLAKRIDKDVFLVWLGRWKINPPKCEYVIQLINDPSLSRERVSPAGSVVACEQLC